MATLILDNGRSDTAILKAHKNLFESLGITVIRISAYNPKPKKIERVFKNFSPKASIRNSQLSKD